MVIIISVLLYPESNWGKHTKKKKVYSCRRILGGRKLIVYIRTVETASWMLWRPKIRESKNGNRAHFHSWNWSSQVESQIVRIPLQSFIPCLFSLLTAVKLKPEIVSQGELIIKGTRLCARASVISFFFRRQ